MFLKFISPDSAYECVFEDDGRVAYAYLRRNGAIVADVWLYNRDFTPETPEWGDRAKAPFRNPRPYVNAARMFTPVSDVVPIEVRWDLNDTGGVTCARLLLEGVEYARLALGSKPGWSAAAAVNGPLAQPLTHDSA